ncbi:2'-5' RNA ligase family protein [Amycolatopsis panacis]|uniref:RNA 2',3'-cyclic phosphodiesterase n=1 Tax=Amycolatopsis panacis TaxID=2340917 RepID=A0A419HTQ4_9PSEU|nr:2'-5' RNA ligase family protein [Amycolatopsis panacis]RJQ80024.1 RNA 2',3'-cyclic phosphodiesterase [Amycolatopsis panacis]
MRLFCALRPPPDVAAAVREALGVPEPEDGVPGALRWTEQAGWHITLAFYAEGDPAERVEFLAGALHGRPAIDVRLRGSGTFPGVLWLAAEGDGLAGLARAAGAGDRPYRAHLTLARHAREHPGPAAWWAERLAGFASRDWTAAEVLLLGSGGTPYRTVGRFGLHRV